MKIDERKSFPVFGVSIGISGKCGNLLLSIAWKISIITIIYCLFVSFVDGNLYAQTCNADSALEISKILKNPHNYIGKKISIKGYYKTFLCPYLNDGEGNEIFLSSKISEKAHLSDFSEIHGSLSCVIGKFQRGLEGMGCSASYELTEIESIVSLSEGNEFSPLGFKLKGIIVSNEGNKAIFEDQTGKCYSIREGMIMTGVIQKKIEAITKNKVLIKEYIQRLEHTEIRTYEITLHVEQ